MEMYVLIGISLSLLGVAGLQFFYLSYLESLSREHKKRITELELRCMYLNDRLFESDLENRHQATLLKEQNLIEETDEIWADVIDD
jgi:uncharacterized membrane protein